MKKIIKSIIVFLIFLYLQLFKIIFGIQYINNYIQRTSLLFTIPYILKIFGAQIGNDAKIKNISIDNAEKSYQNIKIGNNVYIGKNVFFDLADKIIIEDEAVLAGNVQIYTHGDVGERLLSKYYSRKQNKVVINKGAWIGAGSIILYGSVIEKESIVAAGSVIKGDVKQGWIYGGKLAEKIKQFY
ncbi:MAG: acyltransferase [Spirochaetes bacterium]|nr:acyltransferase [Spirochaetota bacterium]